MSAVKINVAANPPKMVRSKSCLSGFIQNLRAPLVHAARHSRVGHIVLMGTASPEANMLFNRLIETVETHSDEIVTSLVNQVRRDPELRRLHSLPDPELRRWASHVVTRLSGWLAQHQNLADKASELGGIRARQMVPLPECVREILLLKNAIVDFVREHAFANTQVDLYAEEEVEHLVHRCFDTILFQFVKGYETAPHKVAAAS